MAGKKQEQATPTAAWRDLTWEDVEAWTNARSLERGKSYQRSHRVQQLAISPEGVLLAWVQGTHRYATKVELTGTGKKRKLASTCTCPVGFNACKHAVAVVLDYLDALKNKRDVRVAKANDPRWLKLEGINEERDAYRGGGRWDEEDYEEDWEENAEDEEGEEDAEDEDDGDFREQVQKQVSRAKQQRTAQTDDVRAYLEGLPAAELVQRILQLARDYPELARDLRERAALAQGKTGELVRQLRKDIRRLTAQEAWQNHWNGEGHLPDYSGVRRGFEQLLQLGQADALLELGQLLFTEGTEQVGHTDDEGETASAIGHCMDVVFRAVPQSSLADRDKLLYVIDMELADEYELCQNADNILDKEWPAAAWSAVADELARRLRDLPAPDKENFSARYRRDGLSNYLTDALAQAGRETEILPLYEEEARQTGSYERLVQALIEVGRLEDARRWAVEGIEKTDPQWSGIATKLRNQLRELSEREKDWPTVAAMHAEEFFERPSVGTLTTLEKAAKRAGCAPEVRAAALHFLETGQRPKPAAPPATAVAKTSTRRSTKQRGAAPATAAAPTWPLPEPFPGVRPPKPNPQSEHFRRKGPYLDVLLELALAEKRPDDVLRWYDKLTQSRHSSPYSYGYSHDEPRVAEAIAATHPDRAIAMYRKLIEGYVAQTSPSAYEAALPFLRKLRDLYQKHNRTAEWTQFVTDLRSANARKRRFMEVLDRLQSKRIVED